MAWFGRKKKKEKDKDTHEKEMQGGNKPELRDENKPDEAYEKEESGGFFRRLKNGLSKTRQILTTDIEDLFTGKTGLDDDLLEEIEEILITSDMGVNTTMTLMEKISKRSSKITNAKELKNFLKEEIIKLIDKPVVDSKNLTASPHVIMMVGVNGVGKTTTIGKLAAQFSKKGKKVLIAAADTFRAAAIEQLDIWAKRAGAEIVKHKQNSDPAAVAYDGVKAAMARNKDLVIIDTAGRIHTKINLMEELKKINRAVGKNMPDAPHETLLVLDATTGQNAISQAKMFNEALGITGLVLTKLDGTAKGGVVISICDSLNIPIKYIGVGEGINDLQNFNPVDFTLALFD